MEEIQYIGEHLAPRYLGHAALLVAFFAGLLSTLSYFLATQYRGEVLRSRGWHRLGQLAFIVHGLGVFTLIGCIFYAMLNQYYEYNYVSAHVSADLQQRYIFSAFWEGQEGSFLLWSFWHVVLGYVLLLTARQWERPVMAVLGSVQVIIVSMLLGVHFGFGDWLLKLGSNPVLLLRETVSAPIFQQADYVELLRGSGLNPSLQNYWMTIHPPTLFLGFASTVVPFAYAVAGLWTGRHREWLAPGLRWSLFSAGILGVGILMGAAWAYEALNFGGYWAWDPVENTSLVPWLMLVAGVHTNLVSRATGQGIRATYLFYLGTFVLIIYSTFLTRSGVLGDTSVHAFTEMGLEAQLLFFLGFYTLLSVGLMGWRWASIPVPEREESLTSREFWMFIGSLVLFMSAVLITGSTSLPVYNEIREALDPSFVGISLTDPEEHHNRYQLWVGIFVALLAGGAQYLRWRERSFGKHARSFLLHTLGAVAGAVFLGWLTLQWIAAPGLNLKLLLFAGWFAVWTNVDHLIGFARRDAKVFGSVISHVGFGLMLIGILASATNKRIISQNQFLMEGLTADEELARTTVTLFRDVPLGMEDLELTYRGDTIDGLNRTYLVDYVRRDPASGAVVEEFRLEPNVLYDKGFEKIAITNPSTKHYWDRDVFTVIMSLAPEEQSIEEKQKKEESLNYRLRPLAVGQTTRFRDTAETRRRDTFLVRNWELTLNDFIRRPEHPDYVPEPGDIGVSADLTLVKDTENRRREHRGRVALVFRNGLLYHYPAQLDEISTRVRIDERIFNDLLVADDQLDYREYLVAPDSSFALSEQHRVEFLRFNPRPEVDHYQPRQGDIAVGAQLRVYGPDGGSELIEPVFIIRDNQPSRIRDESRHYGVYANLVNLDPATNRATLLLAEAAARGPVTVPLAVATNSLRADWIGLQAIEFPGINLFWIGTIMMMGGLLVSMVLRLRARRSSPR